MIDWLWAWQILAPPLLAVAVAGLLFAYLSHRRLVRLRLDAIERQASRCPRDVHDTFGRWLGRCVRHDAHAPDDCTIDRDPKPTEP